MSKYVEMMLDRAVEFLMQEYRTFSVGKVNWSNAARILLADEAIKEAFLKRVI